MANNIAADISGGTLPTVNLATDVNVSFLL